MPTNPLQTVIYRELQIQRAQKFLAVATPLFQELVNYGSNALIRCATSSRRGENEDLAPLNLYRHILEMTDACEVLLASSCAIPCILLIRSSFEALMGMEFIFETEVMYVKRSLAWLLAYAYKRRSTYESMLEDSPRGKEFRAAVAKDKWTRDVPVFPQDKIQAAIDNMDKLLARPQFAEIEAEYRSFKNRPEWYQLFGGPPNIQQLAYRLNHHVQYDFLYRHWSAVSHAQDFSNFIAVDSTGESGVRGIRDAGSLQEVSRFAATLMVEATRILIKEFRPTEDFSTYYVREVSPLFRELSRRDDFFV